MLRLNSEILFGIGKQLIENGDSDAVMKFALAGKEPFDAMKKVFSSVTTLKLYDGYYFIGWETKGCKFQGKKPHSKFLMSQIGNRVVELHIDCNNVEFYQPIIDNVFENKRLSVFVVGKNFPEELMDNFFQTFSSTLKYVAIPCHKMTETFRDALNLESLIVMDYERIERFDFFKMCCKTKTLQLIQEEIKNIYFGSQFPLKSNNTNLSSIKHASFDTTYSTAVYFEFDEVMKYLCCLEVLQYKFTFGDSDFLKHAFFIDHLITLFTCFVERCAMKVPPKLLLTFKKGERVECDIPVRVMNLFKEICYGFEFVESNNDYYRLSKTFESADKTKSTILNVQFFKSI